MKIPTKKLQTGFEMPVLGIGTWEMGGRMEQDPQNDDSADTTAIRKAIELGITHIDTAESYANGYTEKLIGEAITGLDRKKLFITTKVPKYHLKPAQVKQSIENSLKNLNTDYIDLFLIHAPNDEVPLKETLKVMDRLVDEGVVRNIGVSNFKTSRLELAQKIARHKIVTNQVYYNLIVREPEHSGLLRYCQAHDIFLTAYRPLEKGTIDGARFPILTKLAEKYGKKPSQIALNWLISQQNVLTIFKARSTHHIEENLGSLGWILAQEDIEMLRKEFPAQIARSENLPLM